jgi:hypothetical protein
MKDAAVFLLSLALSSSALRAQETEPLPPLETGTPEVAQTESTPAAPTQAGEEASAKPAPASGEQPSAELIIDAEEAVAKEPGMSPGDEPLPQLDGQLPGEENIFGDDLFGTGGIYNPPSEPEIPPTPPLIEDPSELERKMRVKFRKLKASLENSPELVSLKEMAKSAPTPEDYRAARRSYYALFFEKVRRADNSMKDYADKLEKQSVAGLYQTRIEPTVALNPPPEPQPQAQFIPANEYPDLLPADEAPVALP